MLLENFARICSHLYFFEFDVVIGEFARVCLHSDLFEFEVERTSFTIRLWVIPTPPFAGCSKVYTHPCRKDICPRTECPRTLPVCKFLRISLGWNHCAPARRDRSHAFCRLRISTAHRRRTVFHGSRFARPILVKLRKLEYLPQALSLTKFRKNPSSASPTLFFGKQLTRGNPIIHRRNCECRKEETGGN